MTEPEPAGDGRETSPDPPRTDADRPADFPARETPEDLPEFSDDDGQVLDLAAMKKLRNENKTLRKRTRELESAHEADREKLSIYEKREIERAAGEHLVDPEDIWRVPEETRQEWFDSEFGELRPDAVRDSARAIAEQKPHLARTRRPPSAQPLEGLRAGASPEPKKPPTSWAQALRG